MRSVSRLSRFVGDSAGHPPSLRNAPDLCPSDVTRPDSDSSMRAAHDLRSAVRPPHSPDNGSRLYTAVPGKRAKVSFSILHPAPSDQGYVILTTTVPNLFFSPAKEEEGNTWLLVDNQSHTSSSGSSSDYDFSWQWPTCFWTQFKVSEARRGDATRLDAAVN